MTKELFVSSTPHETKVGMVEDDQLAEVYLERENEYTLAGSIYKGRVTRVLPGMQSAFVDIGLERDAFLYVSDFMELEEHDDDLTDVVPANRAVPDLRPQLAKQEAAPNRESAEPVSIEETEATSDEGDESSDGDSEVSAAATSGTGTAEPGNGSESGRERGGWRGRRRRRGGRRERGFERGSERPERAPEPRFSRPVDAPSRPAGPPAGYTPILLPGESISKYQRFAQQAPSPEIPSSASTGESARPSTQHPAAVAATFPEDEPIFAAGEASSEPLHEEHDDVSQVAEETVESAATSTNWSREFRRSEEMSAPAPSWRSESAAPVEAELESEDVEKQSAAEEEKDHLLIPLAEEINPPAHSARDEQTPVFAAPGTMEEETIDDEEADTIPYQSSSDEGYEEFEEETRAANQMNGDAREAVTEIHMASLAESGVVQPAEATPAEGEEDSEEIELEEAQAQAEALLDAEARGNGTVDARAEVRAPAATAGYTQRTQRPRFERPGYERRGGDRGRRGGGGGGRRFRRRESAPVPLISDLLKEGQEILVLIAKEPIGKKGARITSHIALPGRFLVYMPTVNHTGVSRKIASEDERLRLKRIIQSERENGHGGFIVRTAAQGADEQELRADIRFLKGLWNEIRTRAESSKPPALIYHDLNVVERILRDQVTSDFSAIWVDTEQEYERILRFANRFQPALVRRVKLYTKETPLFEQFGLNEEINKALKSKVWLKSGGYIVINQTEALVAIDVNTGKYVGKTSRLEDTIVKTNVDAI